MKNIHELLPPAHLRILQPHYLTYRNTIHVSCCRFQAYLKDFWPWSNIHKNNDKSKSYQLSLPVYLILRKWALEIHCFSNNALNTITNQLTTNSLMAKLVTQLAYGLFAVNYSFFIRFNTLSPNLPRCIRCEKKLCKASHSLLKCRWNTNISVGVFLFILSILLSASH